MRNERIEVMQEILGEVGVILNDEQVKEVVENFTNYLEMEREMSFNQHVGYKEPCQECNKLRVELKGIKEERDIYHNSVIKRRNASRVWIEGDTVKYE